MKVVEWFDYICLQRGFLVWSGNCCAAKLSKKFVSLFVRLQLSLSEIDTIQVILHFSLPHSESIAVAVFFLDLPLLGDLPAVVDCLDDLKAVLHFHILLHHLAEEFVLHLPNHTPFRDHLKVLPEFVLLAHVLAALGPFLLDELPLELLQLLQEAYLPFEVQGLVLLKGNEVLVSA